MDDAPDSTQEEVTQEDSTCSRGGCTNPVQYEGSWCCACKDEDGGFYEED